jgi:hypothetical protein
MSLLRPIRPAILSRKAGLTQFVVNVGSGNGGFRCRDNHLIQPPHDIACGVEPGHGSLLVGVDDQASHVIEVGSQIGRKVILRRVAQG